MVSEFIKQSSCEFEGIDAFLTETAGSPAFMAPEALTGLYYRGKFNLESKCFRLENSSQFYLFGSIHSFIQEPRLNDKYRRQRRNSFNSEASNRSTKVV